MTLTSGSINLLEWLKELRESLFTILLTGLLQRIIKDTNEQPDEEIHRVRSRRIQRTELLSPGSVGCMGKDVLLFTNLKALQTPSFLWRIHYLGMVD